MDQKRPVKIWPSAALPLLLAGCGNSDAAADKAGRIECVLGGAARFERICSVEGTAGPNGRIITIRGPSGSFRRLLVARDGGLTAADGADPAIVSVLADGRSEVAIAGDRYRIPAAVRQ